MKNGVTRFAVLSIIGALASTGTAFAGDMANSWVRAPFDMEVKSPEHREGHNTPYSGEILYMKSDTENGLVFICLEKNLWVTPSLTPRDLRGISELRTVRNKTIMAKLVIDGETVSRDRWLHQPSIKMMGSFRNTARSNAAKIYNAAIRGQSVTIAPASRKAIEYKLPKPNKDFAEFGSECGLGTLANT